MDGNISGGVLAAEKIQELLEKKFDLPHTANYAGLLIDSQEVPSSEVFNASPSLVVPEWCVPPSSTLVVTHSQKDKETHFDPIQCPEKQETEAKSLPKPKGSQTRPPIPTCSNLRPAVAPVQLTP
jgi:hypothetical protein